MPVTPKDLLDALEAGLESFDQFEVVDVSTLCRSETQAVVKVLSDSGEWGTFRVTIKPE